ncbi:hypothetical protein ASG81_26710 [Paenibacillus sp. Soil522]|nr:hypothetical protein ASG81_26710 [Paenibacillus sp. Soil522]
MYEGNKSYMSEKTPYYDTIVKLLEARQKYVSGDQKITYYPSNTSSEAGKDLIASVRFGTSRDTGAATVISNNPHTNTIINVDLGKQHANQTFVDATGFSTEALTTDTNGILTVPVLGKTNPLVRGYLGVWVPAEDNKGKRLDNGIKGIDASLVPSAANGNTGTETGDKGRNGHEWQKTDMIQIEKWLKRKHE